MLIHELLYQITQQFAFTPTSEQVNALRTFSHFMLDTDKRIAMIFCGSAGTGKTTLASAIAKTMVKMGQRVILLAPTGRAAKVFSINSELPAYTIHRQIYRQKLFDSDGGVFNLNFNKYRDTLFIIDESSMIQNQGGVESSFGSGCLLDDLIHFVYSGNNCRLMLMGDAAQLPPIGEDLSPALSADFLQGYGLKVYACYLTQVLRQSKESGILYNATLIRQYMMRNELSQLPCIHFDMFADIEMVAGNELIETLNSSYSTVGIGDTMVVTRSNKRANIYNQGIRNMILGREEELSTGDLLMIVRNNYYWIQPAEKDVDHATDAITFLANGDSAVVQRVRNIRQLYGFRFADVWLQFPDYNHYELKATVILDSLHTEAPALSREQNEHLFQEVLADYADIPQKTERIKKLRQDKYLNAIQIKYAYAVTCHKAQGGQWAHVYIDQGYITADMLTPDYLHWLYTAFTRATQKLYLVNWPKNQIASVE